MKIAFPLYAVITPDKDEELDDCVLEWESFQAMEKSVLAWQHSGDPLGARNPVLHNDTQSANDDARARLAARDAAKKAEWVPLSSLRPGAIFETKDGARFVKMARFCECVDLESGQCWKSDGAALVREVVL